MKKPWDLYLRIVQLIHHPDMTIIEICCGTAPASRAASFLGLNSISFNSRQDQISTASSLLVEFQSKFQKKPVCISLLKLIF